MAEIYKLNTPLNELYDAIANGASRKECGYHISNVRVEDGKVKWLVSRASNCNQKKRPTELEIDQV